MPSTIQRVPYLMCAAALVGLYGWLATLGYGQNSDTYAILRTWQHMVDVGVYVPSRGQGYPVPELAIGWLASRGGSLASNTLSVLLALATLALGYDGLRRLKLPGALPATLFVMANPHWAIAGSTSLDYVYGAFFFVLGMWLLSRQWATAAMLALAFATGSRIVYGPLGLGVLVAAWMMAPPGRRRDRMERVVGFCLVSGLFYLPALINARVTTNFLYHTGPSNNFPLAHVVRFLWKTPGLYGNVGAVILVLALGPRLWRLARDRAAWQGLSAERRLVVAGALGVLGYSTLMFAYLPAEVGYQIPSLLAVAVLLATLEVPTGWLAALIASQVLLMVARPDVLTINTAPHGCMDATVPVGATFDPAVKPGVLVAYVSQVREASCRLRHLPHPAADAWVPLPSPHLNRPKLPADPPLA
ncbi:hypothetical protein [Nitrospirillum iridis]|uniref:Glycosyltransferase RgtA/B/C/D-like domain-containing protein n=1 Tax=Nitrospirillum iridis TaxID=765888 RepID=A0A7X0AY51_9PROT|nr:hypothetical protein [Nitrospirillum iridis]MBB6251897.1 hypothetical protein [Nitrospirillum iridis]